MLISCYRPSSCSRVSRIVLYGDLVRTVPTRLPRHTGRCFFGSTKLRGARQLWKASAPPKVKFFFWLAIHNRCWTAARRKKRGLQDCDLCALCHQAPETMNHLLTDCVYTREVWARLRAAISLPQPALAETTAVDQWLGERKLIPKHLRRGFDALFLLVSWMIWKERNSRIFEWSATMPAWLPPKIFEHGNAWIAAGFKRIAPLSLLRR